MGDVCVCVCDGGRRGGGRRQRERGPGRRELAAFNYSCILSPAFVTLLI